MLSLIGTALATGLVVLSLLGIVAGGVRSGSAMRDYSRGVREAGENFERADLDRIQADQRTAPIEVARGLAEAAMSAQTLSSPDVPGNPIPLGFTDGMSIGQLVVQDADGSASEEPPDTGSTGDATPDTGSTGDATQGADLSGMTWMISIEVDGQSQPGIALKLEGSENATLLTNPVSSGTYVFDTDDRLYVDLTRTYPVKTDAGTVNVPERIVLGLTVGPDFQLSGEMSRDAWQVNNDGSMQMDGLVNYPVRGELSQ